MVVAEATDIRDTSDERFDAIEALTFRASMFRIVAVTDGAPAASSPCCRWSAWPAGRGSGRRQPNTRSARERCRTAARAISGSKRERAGLDRCAGRPGACRRTNRRRYYAIDRSPGQRIDRAAVTGGRTDCARAAPWEAMSVWSTVTSVNRQPAGGRVSCLPAERRALAEDLQTSITTFTATRCAREATLDRSALDAALTVD